MNSPMLKLYKQDLVSVGKGLLIALAGAALTYLTDVVLKTNFVIPANAFGLHLMAFNLTPLVVAGWSTIVNLVRKWIANNQ